jgi:dihydrolipoamide dehydrogenase
MANSFDLVVIGSGPGGYTGAIRAAQLGMNVAIVEKDKTLGGTCLNVGCIPSKVLLESSEHFVAAQHDFSKFGIKVGKVELDLPTMIGRKDTVVKELTQGVAFLMKKNKITVFSGYGSLKTAQSGMHQVAVKAADGSETVLSTQKVMIATGSVPIELPGLAFDGKTVISSTEALSLSEVPKKLIVVGGGYIGLEMGSVWLRLGAEVHVVEFGPKICGTMDGQISAQLQKILTKQGMKFHLKARVTEAKKDGNQVKVTVQPASGDGETLQMTADKVLVAAGRKAFTGGLGLENVGITPDDRGRIPVNEHWETATKNIYAIGDVIAGPMLAHKAEEEGVAAAEVMSSGHGHVNYHTVPGVIYTWPEVASVGYTEEDLQAKGIEYNAGTFPFMANGRAKSLGSTDGQVKVLADKHTDRLLGVHIIGPRASDMIAEAVVAMEFGGSAEDIARSFHAHPTLSEALREAALAVDKRARQT